MFTKRELEVDQVKIEVEKARIGNHEENTTEPEPGRPMRVNTIVNTIAKGSRLTGDMQISHDLELEGEAEGNITSEENSNIIIKGNCKGSIRTKGGNVSIEGEMTEGDIFAGGDVKITGKFSGGKIEARGKIYLNGEFSGKLESNEVEIGAEARGKGEIFYKELISVARGAKIEANIILVPGEQKKAGKASEANNNKNGRNGRMEVNPDAVQQLIMYSTKKS